MTTAIPLTLHLLVVIGAYQLAAGVAGLTGRIDWAAMLAEFERSPALTFVTGFVTFALGSALFLVHHHWTDAPAAIVSAVGWIAIAEGLLIMVVPRPVLAFSRPLVRSQRLVSLFAAAFGLILIVLGLTGRADPTFI